MTQFSAPDSHTAAASTPASSTSTSPTPGLYAEPAPQPPPGPANGRPSTFSTAKLHAVCQFIQIRGVSDTHAAALAGVKRSTLSRWKKDEDVEMELVAA